MRSARSFSLSLAAAGLAFSLIGCTPPAPGINPATDAERARAATQQGGVGVAPSANPAADRNTAATQQGLGAAGVPNPNPGSPAGVPNPNPPGPGR